MRSETMQILVDHVQDCLESSRHIVIKDVNRMVYCVMVKSMHIGSNFVILDSNFLVVQTINDIYTVRQKTSWILDEYTKFGAISFEEIKRSIEDTEIEMEFDHLWLKIKMY